MPFRCAVAGRRGPPVTPRGSRSSHMVGAREASRQTRRYCGLEFSRRDDSPRRDVWWDTGLGATGSARHRPLSAREERHQSQRGSHRPPGHPLMPPDAPEAQFSSDPVVDASDFNHLSLAISR